MDSNLCSNQIAYADGKYKHIKSMDMRTLGVYFGYPSCCIQYFLNRKDLEDESHEQQLLYDKGITCQGFLPCVACARKILCEDIKIDDLIINRKCETPYPIGRGTNLSTINRMRRFVNDKNSIVKRIRKLFKMLHIDIKYFGIPTYDKILINKFIVVKFKNKKIKNK